MCVDGFLECAFEGQFGGTKLGGQSGKRSHRGLVAARAIFITCPQLSRCLSGPALERMRQCAHIMKTEKPCNLRYVQIAVMEITNGQIVPQLLKYFREVEPFVCELSFK